MGSKLVNLEDLSTKITSSKPVVFSLFVVSSCFVSFSFFFWGLRTYSTYGIGYHFEVSGSYKKELISFPGSNDVSIILH